jgi:hypothetical protein
MKKALAGPAKRTPNKRAAKKPERRAMIAAVGRWTRKVDRRLDRALHRAPEAVARWTVTADRRLDRRADRLRAAAQKPWRRVRAAAGRRANWVGRRLRPVAVFVLRAFATGERWLRRAGTWAAGWATRASTVITPQRAILGVVVACSLCLLVSQFIDYRAVEIGQPGYAGLPDVARPPTVGVETAGDAHSWLLVPLALLTGLIAILAMRRPKRRELGRTIAALGSAGVVLILLVDLPAGLDAGAQASRFAGATATLEDGFYAELAACGGLILAGLLYYARPCRTRINLYARAASALRRRPRRRASSRARAKRSESPRRSGVASAPVSRP